MTNRLLESIKRHEGCRDKPYKDSVGVLTVGYGRNLDAIPFSNDEMELMLSNDIRRARDGAQNFYVYETLNEVRQNVLVEMVFQLGQTGVKNFKRFRSAALQQDWALAAEEMIDSRWAVQTPGRARELAELFLKGEYET